MTRKFTFYHADRNRSLTEGMELTLQPNGLSMFGCEYAPRLSTIEPQDDPPLRREWYAEGIRQAQFPQERSRLECIFGANSLLEAEQFARAIDPLPIHAVPIFELFASDFSSHDMNWLDYETGGDADKLLDNMKRYWWREISNSRPSTGDRRPPRIEVKMALPVTVGRLVAWAKPHD